MVDTTMARETQRLNQNQATMGITITITRGVLMVMEDMVDTTMARGTQRLNQNQATMGITITITRGVLMDMAIVIMAELIRKFQQFRQSVEFRERIKILHCIFCENKSY